MARRRPGNGTRALELLLELDLRRGRMRRSLGEGLRVAIQDGRLAANTVLPSSRRLAADLGVSRGVVSDTYDQLASEGYLDLRPRSAPVVTAVVAASPPTRAAAPGPSWRFDFNAVTPDLRLFPRRPWLRAIERALQRAPDAAFDYGHHSGRIELRVALSGYLARVRGVRADPARIVVTQGFTQALDLLCRVLVDRGATTLTMESPSHPELRKTASQSGLHVVGCPVDGDGLRTGDLAGLHPDAVIVSPAHQYPTGAVMAPARRMDLVAWASRSGGLVIEDDYDAEFRYDRAPVGAVQGLDPGRVVHVGTASKTLAPGVRLGWVSLPPELVDDVRTRKGLADSGSPAIDQLAFADLLTSGGYERHVVRARHLYRRWRDRLIEALSALLPRLAVRGTAAGMQIVLSLPNEVDDVAVASAAASEGIGVHALSPLHLTASPDRGLLLGFGRLSEAQVEEAVAALSRMLFDAGAVPRQ